MNIKPIIAAASLSYLFVAGPIFAQTTAAKAQDLVKDKVAEEVKDTTTNLVTKEMASPKEQIIEGAEKMAKPPAPVIIKGAPVLMEAPAPMIDGETVTDTQEPTLAPAMTPVTEPAVMQIDITCPNGTTAQADGTCMITGDYKG